MTIKRQLSNAWDTLKKDCASGFEGANAEYLITERELQAIKNLLMLARERVWLGGYFPKKPDYDAVFDEVISPESIERANESIRVVQYLQLNNQERLRKKKK